MKKNSPRFTIYIDGDNVSAKNFILIYNRIQKEGKILKIKLFGSPSNSGVSMWKKNADHHNKDIEWIEVVNPIPKKTQLIMP